MKFAAPFFAALLALAAVAWAETDQAFTNRATDLRDQASRDAKTVASLPADTAVKVVGRSGAWTQVDANGKKGWINSFHLRFPVTAEKSSSGGGFLAGVTSALGGARESKATVATTGIRGLTPEDLKNAAPDTAALAKAQSYRANKDAAERFARDGKLASVNVDEGGRR